MSQADDTVVFADGATIANGQGILNGSLGTNTLDYSRYLRPFEVNLIEDEATGTDGVFNFQRVVGPPYNPEGQTPENFPEGPLKSAEVHAQKSSGGAPIPQSVIDLLEGDDGFLF